MGTSFAGAGSGQNQYMSYPIMMNAFENREGGVPGHLPNTNPGGGWGGGFSGGGISFAGGGGTGQSFNPTFSNPPQPGVGGNLPFQIGGGQFPWINLASGQKPGNFWMGSPGGKMDMGGGVFTQPTFDPAFTNQYFSMLSGLMGGGSNLQNQLLSFLQGGPAQGPGQEASLMSLMGLPQGLSTLGGMAQTGDPISAVPEWQQMIQAQQHNILEGANALKEQFGATGTEASSPAGIAMGDYFSQATLGQNALLGQLQTQALENAAQRQLGAGSTLFGAGTQVGQGLLGLGANETQFLNQLMSSGALASPGLFNQQRGSSLGGIGSMLGGLGSILGASSGGGGTLGGDLLGLLGL